ncbi:MAG: PspC protein [Paenibacillaceae bacterium]|jgi:phage shock protein PspC (stress-responsive transcriptional regulator)|nr:PspC protein [Paenibacillaceae bacterium]
MRLERSRTDSKLFGLCAGLARSMDTDVTWIRLAFIVSCFLTGGIALFVYIVVSMFVPKEPVHVSHGPYWYVPASQAPGFNGYGAVQVPAGAAAFHAPSSIDAAIHNLEEQNLITEIRELRAKLARYEQQ